MNIKTKISAILFAMIIAASIVSLPAHAGQPVNVNTATAEELAEALDGVGMKKAQAIVELREEIGGFKHADELVNVKGIGLKTVEKNREFIQVAETEQKG